MNNIYLSSLLAWLYLLLLPSYMSSPPITLIATTENKYGERTNIPKMARERKKESFSFSLQQLNDYRQKTWRQNKTH